MGDVRRSSLMSFEVEAWSWGTLGAGILTGFVANWFWDKYTTIIPSTASRQTLSINGIWLAKVAYTNVPGREGLEVMRLREKFGKVYIYKEHYNSNHRFPVRLRGEGVFRGGIMSAYVFLNEKNTYSSMTMTFKQQNTDYAAFMLEGVYTQIIDRHGERGGPLTEPYNLVRIELPFWKQLKRFVGRTYFENFGDIKDFSETLPNQIAKYL